MAGIVVDLLSYVHRVLHRCPVNTVFQEFAAVFVNHSASGLNTLQLRYNVDFRAFTFKEQNDGVLRYFCYLFLCPNASYCKPDVCCVDPVRTHVFPGRIDTDRMLECKIGE